MLPHAPINTQAYQSMESYSFPYLEVECPSTPLASLAHIKDSIVPQRFCGSDASIF